MVVEAAAYPPLGRRSFGQLTPTWAAPGSEVTTANERLVVAVMIESAAALDQVDAIAAVEGLSMLFVGPYDLALSLGTSVTDLLADTSPGSALHRIRTAAEVHGLQIGGYGGDPAGAARFEAAGFGHRVVATDSWITRAGTQAALSISR